MVWLFSRIPSRINDNSKTLTNIWFVRLQNGRGSLDEDVLQMMMMEFAGGRVLMKRLNNLILCIGSDSRWVGSRLGADLVFLTECRISGRIIRHALPEYPTFSCRIPDIRPDYTALPDIRPNPNQDILRFFFNGLLVNHS